MKKYIIDPLKNGCVIFTLITLFSYTLGMIISSETEAFIPSLKSIFLFFFFSALLAYANMILKTNSVSLAVRLILHYISCAFLIFSVFALGGQLAESGFATLIIMLAFTFLYAIIAIICALIKGKAKRKENTKEEYKSKFS